ncbi:MAG: SCP2 sterol-binding domain-containing protein [Candidatus Caenarcaniphilales bacterium]|nr:SCP2 sterol-binding domain-containing protein [Candidatus Caenarcaniphilales bacterium]
MSVKELFKKVTNKFNKKAAENVSAIYLFQIDDQDYRIQIKDQACELLDSPEKPNVTLKADQATWESIINGSLSAQMAFMLGKLNVSGDMPLALKLPSLFGLG